MIKHSSNRVWFVKDLLILMMIIVLSSCSNSSPQDAIESLTSSLKNKDYSGIARSINWEDFDLNKEDENNFEKYFRSQYNDSMTLVKMEILNSNQLVETDGKDSLKVCTKLSYSDGTTNRHYLDLVKNKKGKWGIIIPEDTSVYNLLKGLYHARTRVLSDKGYAPSQYNMAILYNKGKYVPKDSIKYIELLKESAKSYPTAMRQLGLEYYNGTFITKDLEKSFELFKKAYDEGNLEAIADIAEAYEFGLGVEEDYKKALEFAEKGVKLNVPRAYFVLGHIYEYGVGGNDDDLKAFELFTKGRELGNEWCTFGLGRLYYWGEGVNQDFSLAFQYLNSALQCGVEPAKVFVADCYLQGLGTAKNLDKAKELLKDCPQDDENVKKLWASIAAEERNNARSSNYWSSNSKQSTQKQSPKRKICIWCQGQGVIYTDVFIDVYPGHWEKRRSRCTHCFGDGYIIE